MPKRQTRSLALLFAVIFILAASENAAEPTLMEVWPGKAQFDVEQSAALVWK